MKNLKLISMALCLIFSGIVFGQVSFQLNLNSAPPHSRSNYYYLPDVEAYYDIHESRYIYFDGRNWVHSSRLPGRYSNYDINRGHKVIISDYRGRTPYTHFNEHRKKYRKNDAEHSNWKKDRHDNREIRITLIGKRTDMTIGRIITKIKTEEIMTMTRDLIEDKFILCTASVWYLIQTQTILSAVLNCVLLNAFSIPNEK